MEVVEQGALLTTAPGRPGTAILEASRLCVLTRSRVLLREVSLSLAAGELVALIGPSGAGKTTLLEALSGSGPLDSGIVTLAESSTQQRYGIGYVPSDDPLHDELTVAEELLFAAALRGPADASADAIEATVSQVLEELALMGKADQRIASLSRGERRRVTLAVELVGQPDVLLLDEPGSGLDAGLERRLMELLRGLADQGRAILAATHATASLGLCHRVAVMGPGGVLQYVGPVDQLLVHFGVDSVDEIYERLEALAESGESGGAGRDGGGRDPGSRKGGGGRGGAAAADPELGRLERPSPLGPPPGFFRQLGILVERSALCRLRDARSLAVLIGQAPIIGLAIALVLPRDAVISSTLGPYYGVLVAFLLLTGAIWLGTVAACRDIVSEVAALRRESAVGLRLDVYMFAKCLTLFPVVVLQAGLLAVAVVVIQPMPDGAAPIVVTCMVTGLAAACFGLWLSAWARNSDIAVGSTPLIMIPQLLLAGALIPTSTMSVPFRAISDVFVGRWSFDALGSAIGLNQSLGSSLAGVSGLTQTSFASRSLTPCLVMAGLGVLALFLAGAVLANRIRT
jgi:ABC-type multidrug transport system ATPase subunit